MKFRWSLCLITLLLATSGVFADTWIARCNNMQFNYNRKTKVALFYMKTSAGILQIAKGKIVFDNGTAVRAYVTGNSFTKDKKPMLEIGINRSRKNVYVFYRHPYKLGQTKSGVFGNSSVQISSGTWIARCNKLQFNFSKKSSLFYLNTSAGIFQFAKGTIDFDNGTVRRGHITGNGFTKKGEPILEIGLNRSRKQVYVYYRHPYNLGQTKSGIFGSSTIQVVP